MHAPVTRSLFNLLVQWLPSTCDHLGFAAFAPSLRCVQYWHRACTLNALCGCTPVRIVPARVDHEPRTDIKPVQCNAEQHLYMTRD